MPRSSVRTILAASAATSLMLSTTLASAADPKWGLLPDRNAANLLANPSAEVPGSVNQIPGWQVVTCPPTLVCPAPQWQALTQAACGTGCPSPHDGQYWFYSGVNALAELRQDVDVSAYAAAIDAGTQAFEFSGFVTSFAQSPADSARIVVEYQNAGGGVLATFDTGETRSTTQWLPVGETRMAPSGTRTIRVRLLPSRYSGTANDGYFDHLALRAISSVMPTKAVYFFPGPPPYETAPPDPSIPDRSSLQKMWTQEPVDDAQLLWDVNAASQDTVLGEIASTNANVVVMSYWGDASPNGRSGPMKPIWPASYDGLFEAAARAPGQSLRILPAIEGVQTPDSLDECTGQPAADLSNSSIASPWLVSRIKALLDRYYVNPEHPEWRAMWQTMFDREGKLRIAFNLLHVGAAHAVSGTDPDNAAALANALDSLGDAVEAQYIQLGQVPPPLKVGFTIDPKEPNCRVSGNLVGYVPQAKDAAWFMGVDPGGQVHGRSLLAIQAFNPEIVNRICFRYGPGSVTLPDPYCDPQWTTNSQWEGVPGVALNACYEVEMWTGPVSHAVSNYTCTENNEPDGHPRLIEKSKREWVANWVDAGVPLILDVSPGYDGHRVFWPDATAGIYGDNSWDLIQDSWRNHESAMKRTYAGGRTLVGMVYNAWNGFAEGLAATPFYYVRMRELAVYGPYTTQFEWVTSQFSVDPRFCDHRPFVDGHASGAHTFGAVCGLWQCLGAEASFGEPIGDEIATLGGGGVKTEFENGGTIYHWSDGATVHTHELHGAINRLYKQLGEDLDSIGLPLSDESNYSPFGRFNAFQRGYIAWIPGEADAFVVRYPEGQQDLLDYGNACAP